MNNRELTVVMPVYNEEACIAKVLQSWHEVLRELRIDFMIMALNDGSTDGTENVLRQFRTNDHFQIINKKNSGHGPTILTGYHEAVEQSEWVFQVDSDDEMSPEYFHELWNRRHGHDALVDVNTPYRLIRSSLLREIIRGIPADTFAPNLIITGMLARSRARIYNFPVRHEGRKTGTASIVKWKLWRAAGRSFFQTIVFTLSRRN
jgi:glycosyltransferase involved in cell wall biosynthesis